MENLLYTAKNFFTHKDFLVHEKLVGMLFSPLHLAVSAIFCVLILLLALRIAKKSPRTVRNVLTVLWACLVVFEVAKIVWEATAGKQIGIEWGGVLPLYPCSIFLYAMPFALFGNEWMKKAACGYVFTLGLLGAAINFFYPVNVLSNYSFFSFAGMHTMLFHGVMLFAFLLMQITGYHRYTHLSRPWELILPAIPALLLSVPANLVNYSSIGSDYMFFKGNSFFLPAIFGGISDLQTTILFYLLYLLLPVPFYLPGMLYRRKKQGKTL